MTDPVHKSRYIMSDDVVHDLAYKFMDDYRCHQTKNQEMSRCLKYLLQCVKILDTCSSKAVICLFSRSQ